MIKNLEKLIAKVYNINERLYGGQTMLDKIIDIISKRTNVSANEISPDTNILDLDVDSLDIINIIMDVEYAFSMHFEDEEIIDIRTARDIEQIIIKFFN